MIQENLNINDVESGGLKASVPADSLIDSTQTRIVIVIIITP